jgi:ABC-type Zn uptake system ZnuABC Zn-binding protein ZnuA
MRNAKNGLRLALILSGCLLAASVTAAPLHIVASINDLAAVAREIAGPSARIDIICRPDQDPHSVDVPPRDLGLVRQADVYFKVGVALDPWADDLIRAAHNPRLVVVDCSRGIEILGVSGEDEAEKRTHPEGNPHYWLGPSNLVRIAANIRDGLMRADSMAAPQVAKSFELFAARADSAFAHWREMLAPCRGTGIVTEHPAWDYFARDFGLRVAGVVSAVPDAEPTPAHLARLEEIIRAGGARVFLKEPFASERIPQVLARDTGIQVMTAPPSVGAIPESRDLWSHFDYLVRELAARCGSSR